jgi:hypothetical protein
MEKKFNLSNNYKVIIFFSLLFIFFSTPFYNLEQTRYLGGSDGYDYYLIAKSAPNIAENIQFIKNERFFFPYIVGLIGNTFEIDIFSLFRIFSIFLCIIFIFLNFKILYKLNCNNKFILIALLLIICNPYLIRYFISIPTLITDLIFLNATLLILFGFIDGRKNIFFLGIIIGIMSRQNILAFIISAYATYFISVYIYKGSKFFKLIDMVILTLIYFIFQFINYTYATNAGTTVDASDLYYVTIFGIFVSNFSIYSLFIFMLFPLLSFGPIIYLISFYKLNFFKLKNELTLFILFASLMLIAQPFLGGPIITDKNFIRLANYAYPSIIILIYLISTPRLNVFNKSINLNSFIIFLFLWSLHPTFSKIKIFEALKFSLN